MSNVWIRTMASLLSTFFPAPSSLKERRTSSQANQMLNLLAEQQTMWSSVGKSIDTLLIPFLHSIIWCSTRWKNWSGKLLHDQHKRIYFYFHLRPPLLISARRAFHMNFTMFPLFIFSRLKFTCFSFAIRAPSIHRYRSILNRLKIDGNFTCTTRCLLSRHIA